MEKQAISKADAIAETVGTPFLQYIFSAYLIKMTTPKLRFYLLFCFFPPRALLV
jgi:hypothetical protein